jgi:hypothetical protein
VYKFQDAKVFWTDDERLVLAMRAIELLDQRIYDSPLNIFRAALVALPAARRRRARSMSAVPWFEPLLNSSLKDRSSRYGEETPVMQIQHEMRDMQSKCFAEIISLLREGIAALHTLA